MGGGSWPRRGGHARPGLEADLVGSFDTFIPSLQNGRFNSSFTSFIVTSARTKVIDIVSLYNVGTGFAAKAGSSVKTVNSNVDLCGDNVAVIVGPRSSAS